MTSLRQRTSVPLMASRAMRWARVSKFGLGEKNRMLTRRSILFGFGALVAGVTLGCGGGSGTPATPAAGTLTRMISEDTFTFAVKGSSKYPTGSFSYSGTAVMVATDNVTLGSKSGLVKLTATTNLSFNGEPGSSVSDTWYSYDANGNVLEGIFTRQGDKLLCAWSKNPEKGKRPANFETRGDTVVYMELARPKKGDAKAQKEAPSPPVPMRTAPNPNPAP